ncbi:hypothetical protein SAI_1090, partial [Streptococcus agalactiae H36B]
HEFLDLNIYLDLDKSSFVRPLFLKFDLFGMLVL